MEDSVAIHREIWSLNVDSHTSSCGLRATYESAWQFFYLPNEDFLKSFKTLVSVNCGTYHQ